jgi:hypothetical protein
MRSNAEKLGVSIDELFSGGTYASTIQGANLNLTGRLAHETPEDLLLEECVMSRCIGSA